MCQRTGPLRAAPTKYRPKETTLLPKKFLSTIWSQTPEDLINPQPASLLCHRQIAFLPTVALLCHRTRGIHPLSERPGELSIGRVRSRSSSTDRIRGKGVLGRSSGLWIL